MKLHKLIARTINKYPLEGLSESQNSTFQKIISELNQTYSEFEKDLAFLEHSMEVSSEELIEKNNEIREQYAQIEQQRLHLIASSKMSSLGEMASGIAHEINNPLSIIKLYVEQIGNLIQKGPEHSSSIFKLTEEVSKTVMRIAKIISGKKKLRP